MRDDQIYRFRLTAAGHVTEFARLPGGTLRRGWAAGALAASASGSQIAAGAYYYPSQENRSDRVVVVNTRTGAQRIWRGGSPGGYPFFRVASLSWTGGPGEPAVLGEWCRVYDPNPGGEGCSPGQRQAQIRAITPAGPHRGTVLDGRLLLRQAPQTYLAQALVSPNGSVVTAMVLRGKIVGNPQISGNFPANLSVERVLVATGHQVGVVYRRYLGDTSSASSPMSDPLTLAADAAGSHLILNGGICDLHCGNEFNGWLRARSPGTRSPRATAAASTPTATLSLKQTTALGRGRRSSSSPPARPPVLVAGSPSRIRSGPASIPASASAARCPPTLAGRHGDHRAHHQRRRSHGRLGQYRGRPDQLQLTPVS